MSDEPTRLRLDPETDAELRATLEAARGDHHDDARVARLALRLGPLLGPPASGGGGAGGGGGGGTGPAATAATVGRGASGVGALAKVVVAAAVIGAVGTIVVIERRGPEVPVSDPAPTQAAIERPSVDPGAIEAPSVQATERAPEPALAAAEEIVVDRVPARESVDRPRRPPVREPEAIEVTPEIDPEPPVEAALEAVPSEPSLLASAMRALRSDPAAALAQSELHARHYPSGAMSEEREVIAIDALVRLGRRGDAEARARRFRDAHPGSPSLRRIERILAD